MQNKKITFKMVKQIYIFLHITLNNDRLFLSSKNRLFFLNENMEKKKNQFSFFLKRKLFPNEVWQFIYREEIINRSNHSDIFIYIYITKKVANMLALLFKKSFNF